MRPASRSAILGRMTSRFEVGRFEREEPQFIALRWLTIATLILFLVPGIFAGYRAWVQVRSLEMHVSSPVLASGSVVTVEAGSWARTHVTMRLMMLQDSRADTLMVHVIHANHVPSLDPRPRNARIEVTLGADVLARHHDGGARLVATAIGGPQWLRTPPPLVRELAVTLRTTSVASRR
jgi:hypothetical protein